MSAINLTISVRMSVVLGSSIETLEEPILELALASLSPLNVALQHFDFLETEWEVVVRVVFLLGSSRLLFSNCGRLLFAL